MSIGRFIRRLLIAIPAVLLGLAVLCVIVLNTSAFRNFLLSEIRKQAMQRWGLRVDIGTLETYRTHVALELKNIVVHQKENAATDEPPLLRANSLTISIRFLPLLHGKVRISELVLERPVVHLRIDAQGRSNLVIAHNRGAHGPGSATATIFNLEVQKCAIRSGELYYNDAQIPLDAELHDLKFRASYHLLTGKYTGSLSYDNGRLATRRIRPVEHAMQLQYSADRSGLSFNSLNLAIGAASHLTVEATITNYEKPVIEGNYRGNVLLDDVSNALRSGSIPQGEVALAGTFGYDSGTQKPFLAAVELQGHAHSTRLYFRTDLRTNRRALDLTAISAAYELQDATLKVTDFSAAVLAGQVRGNWQMLRVDAPHSTERLEASLRGVSLTSASDVLAPPGVQRIPIVGTANLDVRASWAASLDNAIAHLRLEVSSPPEAPNSRSVIPVSGLVQADYDGPRDVVFFGRSYLQTSSTKLTLSGMLSPRRSGNSKVSVLLTTSDLREVNSLIALVENASPQQSATSIPELGGSASFRGTVTGTAKNPRVQGQLAAQNLGVDGSRWKSLSLNLQAQPSQVRIQNGTLAEESRGQITFDASAGLQRWSFGVDSPILLHVKATNISVQDTEKLAKLHYPVSGTMAVTLAVKGTKQNPQADGTLTLIHASAWDEPIDKLALDAASKDGAIQSTATLQIPAGTVSADGSYRPATKQYALQVHGNGLHLAKISALGRLPSVGGVADVSANGSGTTQNPSLQANLTIPQLQIRDQSISNVVAQIGVANHHASVTLHSTVYTGSVEAHGDVNLTGSRYATASLDIRSLPVAPVLKAFLPTQESQISSGQTEIHLTLHGPLENPAQLQAHLEIPALSLAYEKVQLALAQPMRADYRNGELILAPTRVQGTGTNLTFGGTIPMRNASATYSLSADGSIDLSVLQQFAPDVHSSGEVILRVRSKGTSPSGMHGELQLRNAVFSTDSIPVGIEGVNAQINLSGTRADIANLSGTAGGGQISARGFFTYGRGAHFNLGLTAKSVRIRYPEGLRSVLSGQINTQGTPASSTLTGKVLVDRMSFTQAFDLSNFAGYFPQESTGPTAARFERGMRLNVAVQSAQSLNLTSSKVSVGGTANVIVRGTLADPVVLGRAALTNGEVFFLGKRFEVQSGTIEFANPVRTEPVVNLRVTTTVEQYNVTLILSGPVDRLKTHYTSDPALPPADIIHLLAFGNTTEEAAAAPSQSFGTSAESVLAQGVTSQLAGKIENFAGISQLTIDPLAANTPSNPGAQVAIQERVTGSLLLTFSTDVTTTQAQTVEVQYEFNKRWSVTVLRDQYGGYGLDLRLHKEF
jgi:translocation and assembly module TamB